MTIFDQLTQLWRLVRHIRHLFGLILIVLLLAPTAGVWARQQTEPDDCAVMPSQNSAVNIRSETSTTSTVTGQIQPNVWVPSNGFVEVDGDLWYAIEDGWIAGWVIRASSACTAFEAEAAPDEETTVDTPVQELVQTLEIGWLQIDSPVDWGTALDGGLIIVTNASDPTLLVDSLELESGVVELRFNLFSLDGEFEESSLEELVPLFEEQIQQSSNAASFSPFMPVEIGERTAYAANQSDEDMGEGEFIIANFTEAALVLVFVRTPLGEYEAFQPTLYAMLDTLTPLGITPEDANPIAYGETVDGVIPLGGFQMWAFEGMAGDVVTIDMTAAPNSSLDSYLTLLDPDGVDVTFNDDGGDDLNSRILDFTLPSTGTYIIQAGSYSDDSSGAFTLTLTTDGLAELPANDAEAIPFLPTVDTSDAPSLVETLEFERFQIAVPADWVGRASERGAVLANDPQFLEFDDMVSGEQRMLVTISDRSTFETVEMLISGVEDTDGLIAEGVRIGTFEPIRLENTVVVYVAPLTGAWEGELVVGNLGPDAIFTVSAATLPGEYANVQPVLFSMLETLLPLGEYVVYEETLETQLGESGNGRWLFQGRAGDMISVAIILAEPVLRPPRYTLNAPDGELVLTSFDDETGALLVINETLPLSGVYSISLVPSLDDVSNAEITLTVTQGDIEAVLSDPDIGVTGSVPVPDSIAYGETVTGEATGGEFDLWTFEGTAGDVVTIAIEADFSPVLTLNSAAGGNEFVFSELPDTAIEGYTLQSTGTYEINVAAVGTYTLTLTLDSPSTNDTETSNSEFDRIPLVSIEGNITYGETIQGTTAGNALASWTFEGTAGDVVTIRLDERCGLCELWLNWDTMDGGRISTSTPRVETAVEITSFTLPTTGTYLISVVGNGAYTLTLQTD